MGLQKSWTWLSYNKNKKNRQGRLFLKPLNTWHAVFLFLILECKGNTSLDIWWESREKGGAGMQQG